MLQKLHASCFALVVLLTGCQNESITPGLASASSTPAVCADCATPPITVNPNPEPCGDLIISSLTTGPIVNNTFKYTIEFKNIGLGAVFIKSATPGYADVPSFQTYRSKDNVLGLGDIPAGGAVISEIGDVTLLPNQTYATISTSGLSGNIILEDYPYFIIVINNLKSNTNDCNLGNNTFVRYLLPILGHF